MPNDPINLGVQKKIDEKETCGFALEYLDFGKAKIKSSGMAGTFNGEFDNDWALLLAFNVNWK